MYLWKAWHDSRGRLLMYLITGVILGVLYGAFTWSDAQFILRWQALKPKTFPPGLPAWMVSSAIAGLQLPLSIAAIWAALTLGSSTVGEHYGERTMEFVVSRPVERWRIVGTEWLLHLGVTVVALLLIVLGSVPALRAMGWQSGVGDLFSLLPSAVVVAMAVYATAYLLTVLTGSGMRGMNYTLGLIFFVGLMPGALNQLWHVETPARVQEWLFTIFDWRMSPLKTNGNVVPPAYFPFEQFSIFLFFAIAMLAASLLYFERREV